MQFEWYYLSNFRSPYLIHCCFLNTNPEVFLFESLPLVSLQYQECEIQVTLRPINQLYRINDKKDYEVDQGHLDSDGY